MQNKKICYIANILTHHYIFNRHLITKMADNGWEVLVIANIDDKTKLWNDPRIKFINWQVDRTNTNLRGELKALRKLSKIIRKEKPDIIHNYTIKANIYGTLAGRMFSRAKIINMISGLGYIYAETGLKTLLKRSLIKMAWFFSLNLSRLVIFQNHDDLKLFKPKLIFPKTIVVRGHGINLQEYKKKYLNATALKKIQSELNLKKDTLVITTTARLIRQKGIIEIYLAAKELIPKYPQIVFLIIGMIDNYNPTKLTRKEIKNMQSNQFRFLTNRNDVKELLSISDIFILASYREGLPISAVEAMAMRLPLITTDVPGCRERIENGKNGILIPAKDPKKLAAAVEKLISNKKVRKEMGAQSAILAKNYDREILVKKIIQTYTKYIVFEEKSCDIIRNMPKIKSDKIQIRKASPVDSEIIAKIHQRNIDKGFLSQLGGNYLSQLYQFIIEDKNNFCLLAVKDEKIIGFIAATENCNKIYRDFLKRNIFLGIKIAASTFLSSAMLRKVIDHLLFPQKRSLMPLPELLAIAVDIKYKRHGVGQLLFLAMKSEFKRRKIKRFITIVGDSLLASNAFMIKMKGIKSREISIHNREISNVYFWK